MVAEKYLYIKTFGCQMNVHDSEQIAALLKASRYESTDDLRTTGKPAVLSRWQ